MQLNFGYNLLQDPASVTPVNTPKFISLGADGIAQAKDIVNALMTDVVNMNLAVGADIYVLIAVEFTGTSGGNMSAIGIAQNIRDYPIITTTLLK